MRRAAPLLISVLLTTGLYAAEPNPTPRQRDLILQLMEATGAGDLGATVLDTLFAQVEKQYVTDAEARQDSPDSVAEGRELFAAFREHASRIDFDGLLQEEFVRIYSRHFTEQELTELIAFYRTPLGVKTIRLMPQLMADGMEAGGRLLTPKIEEAMSAALRDVQKKRPWRQTMSDIRGVATALEAWALDHDSLYPLSDYAGLKELLSPVYIREFPEKDLWDSEYAYAVSTDRQHYRIVSSGADHIFEWDSRNVGTGPADEVATRYSERLEEDLVFQDGTFLQAPAQARVNEED
jgi:hypothetical protein